MPIPDSVKLRVAAAQINPLVGDINGNKKKILASVHEAKAAGVQVLVFPEMIVTGYPVEDLALRKSFSDASKQAAEEIAKEISKLGAGKMLVALGYLDRREKPLNALALIHDGKILARYFKRHLPNYGVFDEFRNFESGEGTLITRFMGVDIAVAICEDIWREHGPMSELATRKPGLLLVPNGSPYERSKDDIRLTLLKERAKQISVPIIYANMVGGQDDLVFDGDSIIVSAGGDVLTRAAQFEETLLIADIDVERTEAKPDFLINEDIAAPLDKLSNPVLALAISSALYPNFASSAPFFVNAPAPRVRYVEGSSSISVAIPPRVPKNPSPRTLLRPIFLFSSAPDTESSGFVMPSVSLNGMIDKASCGFPPRIPRTARPPNVLSSTSPR